MARNIPIKGATPKAQKAVAAGTYKAQARWAQDIGRALIQLMESKDRVASGRTIKSLFVRVNKLGVATLEGAETIVFTLFGRRPGKRPPSDAIEQWVREKPVRPAQGQTLKQVAFAVGTKIAREGVDPITSVNRLEDLVEQAGKKHVRKMAQVQAEYLSEITVSNFTKSGVYRVK